MEHLKFKLLIGARVSATDQFAMVLPMPGSTINLPSNMIPATASQHILVQDSKGNVRRRGKESMIACSQEAAREYTYCICIDPCERSPRSRV